jgi:transcriptional regulator with XRE-family HTH domain
MTENEVPQVTLSDLVADRVREIRAGRGWSAGRLASECAKAGYPQLTESVIANIETGRRDQHGRRRRSVSVDELAAFCRAFDLPLSALLGPFSGEPATSARHLAWMEDLAGQLERVTNALRERGFGQPPDQERDDG